MDFEFFVEQKLGMGLWECQREWVRAVQRVVDAQDIDGLQLLAPADHGKTSRVVVPLILWLMARNKNVRILLVRNTDIYAEQIGRAVKSAIENRPVLSKSYGLFKGDKWADAELTLRRQDMGDLQAAPTLLCAGVGADVQSQRADYIITDDIATRKNSRTDSQLSAISSYFFTELASRLDKTLTMKKTLMFGHRVHDRDIYEENKDRERWLYLEHKAILDETTQRILAPEGHTYAELSAMRSKDPQGFELMYQQGSAAPGIFTSPNVVEKSFRRDLSFHQHLAPEVRAAYAMTAMSVDPAFSTNRWSSHAVFNLWGLRSNKTRTLLWALRTKTGPEQLLNILEMKFRLYMPDNFFYEANQGQVLIGPFMKRTFPNHASKFIPVFTVDKDGSLQQDFNLLFQAWNNPEPMIEIPYATPLEQSYAQVLKEEACSYPTGKRRDTLMAQYIFEKGAGLVREETRRGYVPARGVVGGVADVYRKPFENPFWRKVQQEPW